MSIFTRASKKKVKTPAGTSDNSPQEGGSYAGKTVGRYTFNQLIGKGAVGEVYRAFDERLLRPVAIKVSFPTFGEEAQHYDRIVREAQIIARVEHANIVPIYDVVDHGGSVLIVMRLVNGEDLGQMMKRVGKPLDPVEAARIMYQVMLGMDFAHGKGVVHSDLKPGNIFISESNEIFVLDFGLAALLELEKVDKSKIYGTPLYMPPEQFDGVYLDARSDIYSLGLILYTMITGRHPFTGVKSLKQLISLQMEQVPMPPHLVNPAVSEKFSACVMKALEKEPRKRYYSCRDFICEIERALSDAAPADYKPHELRWDPRVDVEIQARLLFHETSEAIPAKITNLSVAGASILVPDAINIGSKLKVEFDVEEDGNDVTISTQATILWQDRRPDNHMLEVGAKFDDLEDMDKHCLGFYVRDLLLR